MKKRRIMSLLLCLVLICSCFIACGNKEAGDDEADDSKKEKKKQEKTIKPEEYLESKFTDLADSITEALKSGTDVVPSSEDGVGADVNLELAIGEQVTEAYGLTGLKNVGLLFSLDWKDALMKGVAELSLNKKSVLEANVYADKESIFVNLPKYSKDFMMFSLEELIGMSLDDFAAQMAESMEGMPTADDISSLWEETSEDFISCFKHEDVEKKETAGFGDYTFSGDKYISSADVEELQSVIEKLFRELKKYPALEVEEPDFGEAPDGKIYCIYYEGEKDQYAWVISEDAEETDGVGFISAKNGFCLYATDEEETEVLLYSEKESDSKGRIVLVADDEEYVLNYDNYSSNGVDLSAEIENVGFTASIKKKKNSVSVNFKVDAYGGTIAGSLESNSDKISIEASLEMQGIDFGSISLECENRKYKKFQMPDSGLDAETWAEGLDQEELAEDLEQLFEDYPFLGALLGN